MIRDDRDSRRPSSAAAIAMRFGATSGDSPEALRGSSMADRFCAWKGRSERRSIFSVFPLGPEVEVGDLPLAGGAVVLGVQCDRPGRRVLWACALAAGGPSAGLRAALEVLAASGGEAHLHLLASGEAARERIVADLGFPLLAAASSPAAPQIPAMALGASMNPPDWRRQRSA